MATIKDYYKSTKYVDFPDEPEKNSTLAENFYKIQLENQECDNEDCIKIKMSLKLQIAEVEKKINCGATKSNWLKQSLRKKMWK